MPTHIYSVPCLRSIQDQKTNLFSLIDLIDSVSIEDEKKLAIPQFILFSKWKKSIPPETAESFYIRISFVENSNEKDEVEIDSSFVELPEKIVGINLILEIGSIDIQRIGDYTFFVKWRSDTKSKWKVAAAFPISTRIKD